MVTDPEYQEAYRRAIRYLTHRERSQHELNCYLLKREFSCDTVEKVIDALKRANYLNDARFAEHWGRARLERSSLGRFRLRQELLQKGIEPGLVESTLDALYDETDENRLAEACARKRLKSLDGLDPQTRKRRLAGYLERRGFEAETVFRILDRLNLR